MGLEFEVSRKDWNEFCLDFNQYQQINQIVKENDIEGKIHYLELQSNSIYHLNIF
jgi:hypothetical protein